MRAKDFLLLYEAQQELFEVEMSPSNLKRLASQIPGVRVGMEFEMVVPNAQSNDGGDDFELQADFDYDARPDDIEDIIDFMSHYDDNVGQTNSRNTLYRLQAELNDKFEDYKMEEIAKEWRGSTGKEYFETWVKENVDNDEVAEFAETPGDLFGEKYPSKEDYDKFIKDQWENQDSYYNRAEMGFKEEYLDANDFSESAFLRSIGIHMMSDVEDNVRTAIDWPYFYDRDESNSDGESIENIGEEFSDAIGKQVHTSTSYHGAIREADAYSLEPDSSISADESEGEAGLEFISPPMSVDEMFDDLKNVKKWAKERGCYTNDSTGLHINVSIPGYSLDKLDYVKLAILIGDKYVLDQFDRLSNTYARSALDIIKERTNNTEDVDKLLKQLKSNVETIASKILHSGRTDKFTSINTKDDYVEFRSAGGDWLDQNFDKIEKTILRNIVALDAACDPAKYKKEYIKGLYKILKPKDPKSEMAMFAKYMSGQLSRSQYAASIEQTRTERFKDSGINVLQPNQVDENDWEITYDDGAKDSMSIYIANNNQVSTKEDAFQAAKKFKPNWFKPDAVRYVTVTPYKFDEALSELKVYRADYSHKSTTVVAKDEEQAKEFLKLMDPDFFTAYPDREITLFDQNETSKKKIKEANDWVQAKIRRGEIWLARKKIWVGVGNSSYPDSSNRLYIAAVSRDEALDIAKRLDPGMVSGTRFALSVSNDFPDETSYEEYKKAQEDLIREREAERGQPTANPDASQEQTPTPGPGQQLYTVRNTDNGTVLRLAASSGAEAIYLAARQDPNNFGGANSNRSNTVVPSSQENRGEMHRFIVTNPEHNNSAQLDAYDINDAIARARSSLPSWRNANLDARRAD